MKFIYSAFVMAALSMTSCSSMLDENPVDQMPESEAYKSSELIYLNTVADLYTKIGGESGGVGIAGTDRGIYDLNTFTADDAIIPTRGGDWDDGGLWRDLFEHKWSVSNDLIKSSWDYLYGNIVKCNESIQKLTELKEKDPANKLFDGYIAEVRSLRAFYYYYLLDMFARVPIVTDPKVEMKDVAQSSRSQVFQFIVKELQEALPLLKNEKSANEGLYYGRMTKSVAYFIMAKLAINAEVYSDDDWTDAQRPDGKKIMISVGGQQLNCWQAAKAYCDSITADGYALNPGLAGFKKNFSVKNENSVENIFVIPMDPDLYKARNMYLVRSRHYDVAGAISQDGWNGACATLEALKAFGYNQPKVDPRLDATYFTGEVVINGKTITLKDSDKPFKYEPENVSLKYSSDNVTMKYGGARMSKYEYDLTAKAGGQLVHNDWVLFRYADVLLMRAEAAVRNGESGQTDFDAVRNRVGAAHEEATLDNILKERMLELAWEGWRRQDLIRFGKFNDAIKFRAASPAYRQVFPIHEAVLAVNKENLTQNPGY